MVFGAVLMRSAVHGNPDRPGRSLSDLTCVVIPLVRRAAFGPPPSRLHPMFTVADQQMVMATHLLAAIHEIRWATRSHRCSSGAT